MKRPPFLRLIFLPALLIPVQAQPARIHCRFVSIEKSGTAAALQSLPDSGLSDSQLFESLMRDVAQGRATIVADQQTVVMSGTRSKVEAVRNLPVPVEAEFASGSLKLYPDEAGDAPGQTWEMEAMVSDSLLDGVGLRSIDLNMAPGTAAFLQRIPCPLSAPDAGRREVSGPLSLPLLLSQKTATQLLTWTGNTALLSVSPGPADSLRNEGPSCRYQFIRAGLDGEKPVPSEHGWTLPEQKLSQARLHLVTFRLPAAEALSLTLNSGEKRESDATLFQRLRNMAAAGAGASGLAGSSAVVIRMGQKSKVESHANYLITLPMEGKSGAVWEIHNIGESLEAELSLSDERRRVVRTGTETRMEIYRNPEDAAASLAWNFSLKRANGLEEIPVISAAGGGAHAVAADVEYLRQVVATQVILPPSGILRVGLISESPATAGTSGDVLEAQEHEQGSDAGNVLETPENLSPVGREGTSVPVKNPAGPAEKRDPAMTEITFALQSPFPYPAADSGSADSREAADQMEYHALMLSLPESGGRSLAAALKSAGGPLAAGSWMAQVRSGAVPCAAQAAVVSRTGRRGKISAVRNFLEGKPSAPTPSAGSAENASTAAASGPSPSPSAATLPEWSREECGFFLAVEGSQAAGNDPDQLDVNVEIDWDTAPLLSPGEATSLQEDSGAPGTAIPRRCTEKLRLHGLSLRRGQPAIADVRPSNARPGTPEHGRWHALLLMAR